jgi:hypothetical protein
MTKSLLKPASGMSNIEASKSFDNCPTCYRVSLRWNISIVTMFLVGKNWWLTYEQIFSSLFLWCWMTKLDLLFRFYRVIPKRLLSSNQVVLISLQSDQFLSIRLPIKSYCTVSDKWTKTLVLSPKLCHKSCETTWESIFASWLLKDLN